MEFLSGWEQVLIGKYSSWILDGLYMTLTVSGIAAVLALVLGTIIAVMRMSGFKPFQWFALAYTEFFRNTPLLVQIYFWYFGSDPILPRGVAKWLYSLNLRLSYGDIGFEFAAAVIALAIYTSAFIAEEIRSGVFSIPKNQLEASRAVGLSFIGAMWYVILPQAFRIIIPPLISQFLNLIKNSSLVAVLGVTELFYQARQVESYAALAFESFTVVTLIYLVISLAVSFLISWYNKHFLRILKY